LLNKKFFHVIVAKSFTQEAIKNFKNKKNLILIKSYNLPIDKKKDVRSVIGGYLIQDKNTILISKKNLRNVSNIKSNNRLRDDLIFSLKVCKHVKSNAIVLSKNNQTIGIGAGQMSRIDSTKLAILKNKKNLNVEKFVASSDAFFPFNDSIRLLIKNKCKAIVQPMGSINDKKIIEFSKENKLPLYSFKTRLFKH
jgi:phosphoribosylaminoimidazolecarboxamide formyltransferase/IMP cyclohydrolase